MPIIYPSINVSNFAITGSNNFVGNQSINGNITLTGSFINGNAKVPVTTGNIGLVATFTDNNRVGRLTALVETTTGTYHVQASDLLFSNNGTNALITPYAFTSTSGNYLAIFDAVKSGGSTLLYANNLSGQNINVTITRTNLL